MWIFGLPGARRSVVSHRRFAPSLTTNAWSERDAVHHAHQTEKLSAYDPNTIDTVTRLGGGDLQRGAVIMERVIFNQAAQIGFNEIFHPCSA